MAANSRVTLFVQCLIDGIYPGVAEAVVTILRRLNLSLDYPIEQTCCGQPAFNAGYWSEARAAARRFVEIFEAAEAIVCPSGSCVAMVRNHYPDLFRDEPHWLARAQAIGAKTFELTQYLVDILGVEDIGAAYNGRVTYHDSCHLLRHLGIAEQPRKLLRHVRGLDLVEMKDSDYCCGFGGSFSIKYAAISTALVDEKVRNIVDSGADTVTGCDMGCLMNIQGRLSRKGIPVRSLHIAQILAGGQS